MKKILTKAFFSISMITLFVFAAEAQIAPPATPGCQDPNNPFSPPCPIPIDGGLVFLIAAGAAYGGKKAYDLQKRQ